MITEIEVEKIPGRACSYNNAVSKDILEFYESEWVACEVSTQKYKTVCSAFGAYSTAIKRLNVGVAAMIRNGRLFLIREKLDENQ